LVNRLKVVVFDTLDRVEVLILVLKSRHHFVLVDVQDYPCRAITTIRVALARKAHDRLSRLGIKISLPRDALSVFASKSEHVCLLLGQTLGT